MGSARLTSIICTPDFAETFDSQPRECSWWAQFSPAHLPGQVKNEVILFEIRLNFKSLSFFGFNWTSWNLHMMTALIELGILRAHAVQANQVGVCAWLCWSERLRIFILPQLQAVLIVLVRPEFLPTQILEDLPNPYNCRHPIISTIVFMLNIFIRPDLKHRCFRPRV